jgi:putative aminopeptidase FrvX
MQEARLAFLKNLLSTPGPSGDEIAAARVWRGEARSFADKVWADVRGNSFAQIGDGGPRVLLAGHIDEIGLMISHIDEDGYLYFSALGGWDAQVLVGQRVRLLGLAGEVLGVIGKKPIHLMKPADRDNASKIEGMWIDIGAKNKAEALEKVHIGGVGVIDSQPLEMPNGRIVSRSLDNRIGAYTVLEALRLLSENRPSASVVAVATTQEETSFAGATTAAYSFDPQIAIAVDVTFATDHPESDKRQYGDVKLGGGPVLSRGAANTPTVFSRLTSIASEQEIPYSVQVTPRYTGTDADAIHMIRGGVATGVVSIPNRYMHSPNEMVDLADVENAAKLIAAFVRSIKEANEFIVE